MAHRGVGRQHRWGSPCQWDEADTMPPQGAALQHQSGSRCQWDAGDTTRHQGLNLPPEPHHRRDGQHPQEPAHPPYPILLHFWPAEADTMRRRDKVQGALWTRRYLLEGVDTMHRPTRAAAEARVLHRGDHHQAAYRIRRGVKAEVAVSSLQCIGRQAILPPPRRFPPAGEVTVHHC